MDGATETNFQGPMFCLKMKFKSITLRHSSPPVYRWLMTLLLLLQHVSLPFVLRTNIFWVLYVAYPCNAMSGLWGSGAGDFHLKRKKVTFSFPRDPVQWGKGSGLSREEMEEESGCTLHTSPHPVSFSALWRSTKAHEEVKHLPPLRTKKLLFEQ